MEQSWLDQNRDWGAASDWGRTPSVFGQNQAGAFRPSAPYQLGAPGVGNNSSFDTRYMAGVPYPSAYPSTSIMHKYEIEDWARQKYPELYWDDTGILNPGGGSGNVARDPSFGRFAETPSVYGEIEAAAAKYGVPANLVLAMIGRESSGHWGAGVGENGPYDNTRPTMIGDGRIAGYTGIKEATARAWGYDFNQIAYDRASQIDAMAYGLAYLYSQYGAQYGWDGVISTYYSGDPTQRINPVEADMYGSTGSYTSDVKSWWNALDNWTRQNGGTVGGGTTGGLSAIDSPEWKPVNQWDNLVGQAASQYGIPANLLKALMRVESGGVANAISPAGATGLMQVMPDMHGLSRQQLLDPRTNVMKGAEILRRNYDQYGTWEKAAQAYLGGVPGSNASDGFNTQSSYWSKIQAYWNQLDAAASGLFNGPEGDPGPVTAINAIWGGQDFPVTQEHGPGAFASANPGWYDYSIPLMGALGHPGIDVGMPEGTQLFSPVGGTVVVAGPEGGYRIGRNMDVYTPQTGELRIRMDNGHEVILGHMAGIHVTVGERIQPGQYVGLSGSAGTGEHLHLEYRIPSTRFGGTQEAIDPRQALQGLFSGSLTGNTAGPGARPMTFSDVLRAAARGEPTHFGMTLNQAGNYNAWLLAALRGEIPYTAPGTGNSAQGLTGGGSRPSSGFTTSTGHVFRGSTGSNPYNALTNNAIRRT